MNKEVQFKRFFGLTSNITDVFPRSGARLLDALITGSLGNRTLGYFLYKKARQKAGKLKQFKNILVVADLNIGDALISSCGVEALRRIFPDSEIDFTIKNSTRVLIEGNPDISSLFPIYNHAPYPTANDLSRLNKVLAAKDYDLVINYCPMISSKFFGGKRTISYNLMASELMKNERIPGSVNNINFQAYKFIGTALKDFIPPGFLESFKGAKIYLSDEAINNAQSFLEENEIALDTPIVMLNPDASAIYTRMPFDFQVNLLKRISDLNYNILIGAGHVEKLIEQRIINRFSDDERKRIIVVPPSTDLDMYAALIDFSDAFITGDTGPLHIAAARKYSLSTGKGLRNRTAVFSVFGSTPPTIYGYGSEEKNYFPANQDAPSKTFVAKAVCRNISCINKMAKTCKEVRCFDNLSVDEIISNVNSHLTTTKRFYFPKERSIFAQ